jgi:hypothetical protein
MNNIPINPVYFFILGSLLCLLLPGMVCGAVPSQQRHDVAGYQPGDVSEPANPALVGMLVKQRGRERFWTERIQKIDLVLHKFEQRIASSIAIINKARQTGKIEAEKVAQLALTKAQGAKQGYLEQKRQAVQQLRRAQAGVERLAGALRAGAVVVALRGVVSRSAGEVGLLRANTVGQALPLSARAIDYLGPGDEIQTGNESTVELQILSGRGVITMGPNSKLRVEEDNGEAEVVRTLAGKFHFLVDKVEKFEADLATDLGTIRDTLVQIPADATVEYNHLIRGLRARAQKKFATKLRGGGTCSIRGTEYVVVENQDGGSEITVFEGQVAVTAPDDEKSVLVEGGQAVAISTAGKLSEVRSLDPATFAKWWEESP